MNTTNATINMSNGSNMSNATSNKSDSSHGECAPGCPHVWLGDGYCDVACNTLACGHDGGDCRGMMSHLNHDADHMSNGTHMNTTNATINMSDSSHGECAPGCPHVWLGDGYCDVACNTL